MHFIALFFFPFLYVDLQQSKRTFKNKSISLISSSL